MQYLPRTFPIFGLLFGAVVWGLIWYPYRLLEQAGISGIQSSLATYSIALLFGVFLYVRNWRELFCIPRDALWIGIAAGWTNLGYVLAVLDGEVMRVLLLFYLAPLWTLLLARLLLKERAGWRGVIIMLLSLAGMMTMLWQGSQLPVPQSRAEWLALTSGFAFAATNVLTRRAGRLSLKAKSFSVWAGVCVVAMVILPFEHQSIMSFPAISDFYWGLMVLMGLVLAVTTWLVQFGITHIPANRAAVIFMFELVVAAVSSYLLAGEAMTLRESVGGAMIIVASVFSVRESDS